MREGLRLNLPGHSQISSRMSLSVVSGEEQVEKPLVCPAEESQPGRSEPCLAEPRQEKGIAEAGG